MTYGRAIEGPSLKKIGAAHFKGESLVTLAANDKNPPDFRTVKSFREFRWKVADELAERFLRFSRSDLIKKTGLGQPMLHDMEYGRNLRDEHLKKIDALFPGEPTTVATVMTALGAVRTVDTMRDVERRL